MLPLPPLLAPILAPLLIRPFQIALGIAIGWKLRERREKERRADASPES